MRQAMETPKGPQKRSPFAMKCTVNRANLKPNTGTFVYVAVDLTPSAAVVAARNRGIVLAIDSSGSMDGEKIEQAKTAALGLLKQLRPTDQISIISFSDKASVDLPMTRVGNSRELAAAVKGISVSGLTAMYAALEAAFTQARQTSLEGGTVKRVILLTDGNPTVGRTDTKEFITLAQNMREAGITITAIGIGNDYNETLLEKVAEAAGGLWHHIDESGGNLPQVFQDQAAQMAGTVVANPELKVSIMPGSELGDWNAETNPYPRTLLSSAEATVLLQRAVQTKEASALQKAETIMRSLQADAGAATAIRSNAALSEVVTTMRDAQATVARSGLQLSESAKKDFLQATTIIGKKKPKR